MRATCLSFHAAYACRHSGACCTAGWPIPAEPPVIELVTRGRLRHALAAGEAPLTYGQEGAVLAHREGACVFFDAGRGGSCVIHRHAGAEALPIACRNFPRVTLKDGRGLSITLSHYCPTAARMLLDGVPIRIVEAPGSLSLDGEAVGLDATAVLPPLLRPGMLCDLAGYAAWEQHCLAALDDPLLDARTALAVIRDATADTCAWSPGGASLRDRVGQAFTSGVSAARSGRPPVSGGEHARKSFLAAHLFASWEAYQGGGLPAAVVAVERALIALDDELARSSGRDETAGFIEAVRAVDFRLRHTEADVSPGTVPTLRRR